MLKQARTETDPDTGLTRRQAAVVKLIYERSCEGNPPTLRELMAALSINSPNGMKFHIDALRRKGVVEYHDFEYRGVRLKGFRYVPVIEDTPEGRRLRQILGQA